MSKIMEQSSTYRDLNEFLAKHHAKNTKEKSSVINLNNSTDNGNSNTPSTFTHTRIPDKDNNIYPGSYIIPKEELDVFYGFYYTSIFVNKNKEYLTERQVVGGPMVVDFDFRYSYDVTTRLHTKTHISDMVCEYLERLKECYLIPPEKSFDVFIFEKPNVNRLTDGSLTKDGIHMLIGLQVDNAMQCLIREKMIEKLEEMWSDLPLINSFSSVLDEGISKGKTNWQLFGSRKPGNEAYELTHHFIISIDPADGEFMMNEDDVVNFNLKKQFSKLSVQYDKNPKFEINPKIISEYNKFLTTKPEMKKASSKVKMNLIIENEECDDEYISVTDIKDEATLNKAIQIMLTNFKQNEYELKDTHYFTDALPKKYYEPGSHLLNRQVAFALKQTDERLFLSWIKLRSKADDFDYNTIPKLYDEWKKMKKSNQNGCKVTRKSIMFWVRKENFEEYKKIKENTIDYYLEKAFETGTDNDIAFVLKQMFKDNYTCVSYDKKGIWYRFKNHKWVQDKGLSLRAKISEDLFNLFTQKSEILQKEFYEYGENDERRIYLQKKIKMISEVGLKLKKTIDKDHIMREAAELFYDSEFIKNVDTNKYLLCFNNGVVDFSTKTFREGYPEDYITKSTKINYVPYDENNVEFKKNMEEIEDFMNKLFPIPDLKRYMMDHLSSCLIGTNKNQTFNVYHGSGSNGKSIIADLMSVTLGEYKGTVPITLVSDVRGKIGGTSDEVLKLKGVRYAVMQEPSKSTKLNEGIMKELTGGDPIQARGLYSESEIFEPQFSLVVCTNNLFDIESNDDGTWRRIRKCDFLSKFVDEGEKHTDNTQYIFPKDKNLKDKLPLFAPVFASMLVNRAFETGGIVLDCETVMKASNKYRNGQDHISAFINERIVKTESKDDIIGKQGLREDFKIWFEITQGSRKVPKGEELFEKMNGIFNKCKKGWNFVKFVEPDDDKEDDDN